MRVDKPGPQALAADVLLDDMPKPPYDQAKPAHSSQMSHLSVISRMTEQAAAEKFQSESSNPVSLKKPKQNI